MKTSDSLLFFTGDIDFKYLESHIGIYGFDVLFSSDEQEFTRLCLQNKYDLIVYNGYESDEIDEKILESLTGKKNLYTPIVIIAGKSDEEMMNLVLRHQFDLIVFPFTPPELITRFQLSVRRKNTEMSIHNNLVDYNVLFQNFPSGILQTDVNGKFIRFNKELKNILGMNEIDFTEINFFQLCHPDDYLIERQCLDRLQRKVSDIVSFEVRLINNNGNTIVSKIRASSVWIDQDTLGSFIFSIEKIG